MDELEERVYQYLSEAPASEIFDLIRLLERDSVINEKNLLHRLVKMWDDLQEKKAIELGYRTINNG